jgi:hypothetical protein
MSGFGTIVIGYLFNDENKKKIIDELNKSINIPIINERTEEKVFTAMFDVFEEVLTKVLKK